MDLQTKHLQEALAECGWADAKNLNQQDASEAFTFITGKLELPLLTLKMDIYHTGKEDAADDHKFVNERLLEVAIPPNSPDGSVITLENCLETYFNNRIEVKRHLARRNTVQSGKPAEKGAVLDIDTKEVPSTPTSPIAQSVASTSGVPTRPGGRKRAESIFSERYVEIGEPAEKKLSDTASIMSDGLRKTSLKKEVLMPAWQFFSLIRKKRANQHCCRNVALTASSLVYRQCAYERSSSSSALLVQAARIGYLLEALLDARERYASTAGHLYRHTA